MWQTLTGIRTQSPTVIRKSIDDVEDDNVNSVVVLHDVNVSKVVSNVKHAGCQDVIINVR